MKFLKVKPLGFLKPDTPFIEIFPDRIVPLESIAPVIPREHDAPRCYVVDAEALSEEQIALLAERIYAIWQPECESLDRAIACVKKGLPLNINHFSGVGTDYRMFA